MPTISTTTQGEDGIRCFQQLLVDAVELAGSISPLLKAELVSLLGSTWPAGISPTINHQEASLPAVLRMLVYARHEADQISALRCARRPLDSCVAVLVDRASYREFERARKFH